MSQLRVRPTDGELAILQVLWDQGPATVRQVHEALFAARETGYTTTLKLMQIMAEKGLVVRDQSARTHVYTAKFTRDETQQRLVSDLMDRAFGGSAAELVMQVLSTHPTSADELQDIEQMIAEFRATNAPARSGGRK